jgi:hypothetical protein
MTRCVPDVVSSWACGASGGGTMAEESIVVAAVENAAVAAAGEAVASVNESARREGAAEAEDARRGDAVPVVRAVAVVVANIAVANLVVAIRRWLA